MGDLSYYVPSLNFSSNFNFILGKYAKHTVQNIRFLFIWHICTKRKKDYNVFENLAIDGYLQSYFYITFIHSVKLFQYTI